MVFESGQNLFFFQYKDTIFVKKNKDGKYLGQEIHTEFKPESVHVYKWKYMLMLFYVKTKDSTHNPGSGVGILYTEID